jgi:tetraacyldisaccharide 4'-kinase
MMHPPAFWWRPPERPGWQAGVLSPLAALWTWETRRRMRTSAPVRVDVPVICIGNLTIGGAGKTPTVLALVAHLASRGIEAHVVSRGHGGSLKGPVEVDPRRHAAQEAGDEPLLIAQSARVWIGRDRAAAAQAAAASGARAIVMDDGFQNPSLAKDISIVVVDAAGGFGNGRVIPAGPLREPVRDGLARADFVLAVGRAETRHAFRQQRPDVAGVASLDGEIRPLGTGMDWRGQRVFAFAGIGRPAKFLATLAATGAEIVGSREFPDHAAYGRKILGRLEADAKARQAQLVTTEKDAVRIQTAFRRKLLVLPVRLEIDDWAPLDRALARHRI